MINTPGRRVSKRSGVPGIGSRVIAAAGVTFCTPPYYHFRSGPYGGVLITRGSRANKRSWCPTGRTRRVRAITILVYDVTADFCLRRFWHCTTHRRISFRITHFYTGIGACADTHNTYLTQIRIILIGLRIAVIIYAVALFDVITGHIRAYLRATYTVRYAFHAQIGISTITRITIPRFLQTIYRKRIAIIVTAVTNFGIARKASRIQIITISVANGKTVVVHIQRFARFRIAIVILAVAYFRIAGVYGAIIIIAIIGRTHA